MALPKLETPTYELELPSTGEKIKYRPFLVKEQKILMMAQESKDDSQVVSAITDLVTACTWGKVDAKNSPMFDIEYIFLKLRAKSVGETASVKVLCQDDGKTYADVKVSLDEISVQMTVEHTNEIQINDKTKLVLTYPKLGDMKNIPDGTDDYGRMFLMLNKCIQEIHFGDKIYNAVDTTEKEREEFIESMDMEQLKSVTKFFETMPKLRHPVKFNNPKTKVGNEVVLEGLQSFLG
tara:strand:- start:372 stop:1079 length:708 start_codon:yes stop_codon:yes gene_type:complete